MAAPRVWINVAGEIVPAEEARISALDHGFLYGDSVYETLRTHRGVPLFLRHHMERLERSMDGIDLRLPLDREELEREVLRSVREVGVEGEVVLRLVVSRGPGPIGLDVSLCTSPTYLIYVSELLPGRIPPEADPDGPGEGISVVISKIRRNSPRAIDPRIKSGNFLNNILAFRDAREAGAHEALLCTPEGYLAEGTTSNLFVVKGGQLWTPSREGILAGITRRVIIEEARAAGIEVHEAQIPPEDLFEAEEAFISSSVRGMVPIARVNERPVGTGRRGDVTLRLQRLYQRRMDRDVEGFESAG